MTLKKKILNRRRFIFADWMKTAKIKQPRKKPILQYSGNVKNWQSDYNGIFLNRKLLPLFKEQLESVLLNKQLCLEYSLNILY